MVEVISGIAHDDRAIRGNTPGLGSIPTEGAEVGADYIAFGAMFPSTTKPNAPPAPFDLITRARRELGLPVAAIGGITLANAEQVLAAGADLLAVVSDVFGADDPAARAVIRLDRVLVCAPSLPEALAQLPRAPWADAGAVEGALREAATAVPG